eukprot:SAG22_NODE_11158_length_497_cov_215.520101_1_plen_50_part_10
MVFVLTTAAAAAAAAAAAPPPPYASESLRDLVQVEDLSTADVRQRLFSLH